MGVRFNSAALLWEEVGLPVNHSIGKIESSLAASWCLRGPLQNASEVKIVAGARQASVPETYSLTTTAIAEPRKFCLSSVLVIL